MSGFDAAIQNMQQRDRRTVTGTRILVELHGGNMKRYAQINARWIDRTSNARQGLDFVPDHPPQGARGYLGHHVDYGPILERAYGSRYAILKESTATFYPLLRRDIVNLLRGKKL